MEPLLLHRITLITYYNILKIIYIYILIHILILAHFYEKFFYFEEAAFIICFMEIKNLS